MLLGGGIMLFDNNTTMFKVISVLELEHESGTGTASPRGFHALSMRLYGNADFDFGNKQVHIESGDILYVPCNVGYEISQSDEHLIVIHFVTDNDSVTQNVFSFTPQNAEMYKGMFEEILELWNQSRSEFNYTATASFFTLLARIEKEITKNFTPLSNKKLRDIIKYIQKNYHDTNITVESLSNMYGSSGTYFRRIFKEATGTSPLKYINTLRIKYAEELMYSGYYTIREAAEKAGITDNKYFSRIYKQYNGVPPSRFKKG